MGGSKVRVKKIILCEGSTDTAFLGYYMSKVFGWKYVSVNDKDLTSVGITNRKNNESMKWYKKENDFLAICGVGGKDNFKKFFEVQLKEMITLTGDFDKIAVVTDRDDKRIKSIEEALDLTYENMDIPILEEAITLYIREMYYGRVSFFACQLNGIITDTYEMQRSYGKDFDLEDIKLAYRNFNPKKEIPQRIKKDSERTQLLWFITDAEERIVYWIKAIEYIYNIVLTSEDSMNQSNHPCRNKICHGIQLNFGTKEHALKSILAIDMMIRLAESLKSINEETAES